MPVLALIAAAAGMLLGGGVAAGHLGGRRRRGRPHRALLRVRAGLGGSRPDLATGQQRITLTMRTFSADVQGVREDPPGGANGVKYFTGELHFPD